MKEFEYRGQNAPVLDYGRGSTVASRTAGRLLLALAATALLMKTLPAASEGEASVPDAETLLRQSLRLYSEAQTLQVKARTVVKGEPQERRVTRFLRYVDNRPAGLLEADTRVAQCDFRIVRKLAYRSRWAEYGMAGLCRLIVPAGSFAREYTHTFVPKFLAGTDLPPALADQPAERQIRYRDGTLALGDASGYELAVNLPTSLFLFSRKDSFFDPQTATLVPLQARAEQGVVSLRVKARHTLLRKLIDPFGTEKARQKFRFGQGEWIIRINPADGLIQQVDVHEEWPSLRPGAPDGVVDLRETYTDQLLNERLTLEEFVLDPPDPVPAVDLKGRDAGIGKDWEPKAKPEGEPAGSSERER
jgi:hypothetical protein